MKLGFTLRLIFQSLLGGHHRAGRVEHSAEKPLIARTQATSADKAVAVVPVSIDRDRLRGSWLKSIDTSSFIVVAENALEFALARLFQDRIDFFDRGRAFCHERQVDASTYRRHADRKAVQTTPSAAAAPVPRPWLRRLRRDHRVRRAGSAQILVVDVGEHLVVRVRMNRRHQAIAQSLDLSCRGLTSGAKPRRCGRAGGVRHHEICGLKHILINAVNTVARNHLVLQRRKRRFLRTGFDMHHRGFF